MRAMQFASKNAGWVRLYRRAEAVFAHERVPACS